MICFCSWCKITGMENNYLDPDKYDFDNEYPCECESEIACDCVYDPVRGRLVQRSHVFEEDQDEE